jgi:Cu(I)/Ag(I) efflux system membrane fusion protein
VRLGRELGDKLEVLEGLQPGQQVVASGQFLIDSEASMQGVLQRQATPAAPAASAAAVPAASSTASAVSALQAVGRIVELSGQSVTLDHSAVPALKWPAMQMGFRLARPELAKGVKVGDTVRFTFRESQDGYEVVAMQRETPGGAR